MLSASANIQVPDAQTLLAKVCSHYAEHGSVQFDGRQGRIELDFGTARIDAGGDVIRVQVDASDKVNLAYMKIGIAEHVVEMAGGSVPDYAWMGDGAGETTPPFFRVMTVISSQRLTPRMRRIRLAGQDLARFAVGGLHVRLIFPPKGREPVWPVLGADGRIVWPGGSDALVARVYTLRNVDVERGIVDIDIVLHPGECTPGSGFAEVARPGDIVGMTGPGGGFFPKARTLLLFGDETAQPAIARILEALPVGVHARAFVEVAGLEEMIPLHSAARTEVTYLDRKGAPAGTAGLLAEAARSLDWSSIEPDAFVWAGCEFSDFRRIRAFLRSELGIQRERHLVVAYWRRGSTGDEARKQARAED